MFTDVLAIDALNYNDTAVQFQETKIDRELKKSFCGFRWKVSKNRNNHYHHPPIATGNWGCGAFRGDRLLKCKKYNQIN